MQINSLYVDEAYSPIVEKALFEDIVLIPGLTYTDKFTTIAGKTFVHVESKGTLTSGALGQDFTNSAAADSLVPIEITDSFRNSKKIYGVQANTVAYDVIASQLDVATKEVAEARQKLGLAYMLTYGTDLADTTALTANNIKKYVTLMRKKLRDGGAKFDYIIAGTNAYACMLEDKSNFAPAMNDEVIRTGIVGYYLGAPVLECNSFSGTVTGQDSAIQAVDLSALDMIVGASDGLAINDVLSTVRKVEGIDFVGTLAQVEVDSGYAVVNSAKIVYKKNQ